MVTTNDGPLYALHNETVSQNHWLLLKLIGHKSNRDRIGAEIRLITAAEALVLPLVSSSDCGIDVFGKRRAVPSASLYCLNTNGGPLTRSIMRKTVTSTRSAILMKGIPLFMPYSFRSKAIVPEISP